MKKVHCWEILDWKAIRGVTVTLLIIAGVFLFYGKYPDFVHNEKSSDLIRIVDGQFISKNAIEGFSEHAYSGNRTTIDYYEIDYTYKVNGQPFFGSDKIPNSSTNRDFINKLLRGELIIISVRYDPIKPANSQVVVN